MKPEKPKFELSRVSGAPVSDKELLADLMRVAAYLDLDTVPQKTYGKLGTYDYSTLIRRFGSWNAALRVAGLSISNEISIDDECLFKNLLTLWQHYGRQPRRAELARFPSTVSQSPYNRRFGSWTAALQSFVEYANASDVDRAESLYQSVAPGRRLTGRDPSVRLRWQVLQRDDWGTVLNFSSISTVLSRDHIVLMRYCPNT